MIRLIATRGFAVALAALTLSACTHIGNIPISSKYLDPVPPTGYSVAPSDVPQPGEIPTSATPTPTPTTTAVLHAKSLRCTKAPADVLTAVEALANGGMTLRFTTGQMVNAGGKWWVVAVRQWLDPKTKLDPTTYGKTGDIKTFLTNAPSTDATLRGWSTLTQSPDGTQLPDGSKARDKAVSCLPKNTPPPPPAPQPKPSMKCVALTQGEQIRAADDVRNFYGGTIAKVTKVKINAKASVIATAIGGATQDVRGNHPDIDFSPANPRDIVITWLYYKQASRTWSVEVIKNWETANDGTLQWGPAARNKAISCVS